MKLMNSNLSYLRQKLTELELEFDKAREWLLRSGQRTQEHLVEE